MPVSLLSRKRDLAYLIHFSISLPLMFVVDLQSLYPPSIVPESLKSLKAWYIDTYHDQNFVTSPPFFEAFMWTEIFWQAPVMLWAIGALYRNSPKIPVVLLPYATLIFVSTFVCMFDYAHWPIPLEHKISLTTLYGPYLALSAFMGIDMYLRISSIIDRASITPTKKIQ